jgi:hypothetical protein
MQCRNPASGPVIPYYYGVFRCYACGATTLFVSPAVALAIREIEVASDALDDGDARPD